MSLSSFEAAKKICDLSNWTISNLKLQKILYLAHMIYLGRFAHPLINQDEHFEAWDYGPVLPKLYHEVKIFGNDPIQNIFYWPDPPLGSTDTRFLEEACEHFLTKNPSQLVAMTHRPKGAWAKNYDPQIRSKKISNKDIAKEYEQINEG